MVYGTWYMVHGIWCMVYGTWCIACSFGLRPGVKKLGRVYDRIRDIANICPVPPSPLYRGTSLIRNRNLIGPYSRTMSRALWWF